ncbi:MAG: helix-turn-helix transcriptional regulator [Clostridiales bacterium]|nr:helix-turn-helix transcriptional regulator [Clostridiales bacterium]
MRLFAFLALFAAAIVLALSAILSASGVFAVGMNESRMLLHNELSHLSEKAANAYGALTAEGIALSGRLAAQIGAELDEKGVRASELGAHPELLTDVLRECVDPAIAALERNRTSAVFMILDATINPDTNSRAGFFFRNMEPNALTYSEPSLYYLRGPIAIARERNFFVIPQWLMEFPVVGGDFFHKAIAGADGSLPATRTYYWNPAETLTGDYDDAMLLCVPMTAQDGAVLGICGLEVNDLLFKMQYRPDTSVFSDTTVVLAPVMDGGSLNTGAAMFSCTIPLITDGVLTVSDSRHGLQAFESAGNRCLGLSARISLYSKNTAHSGEWRLAVLVPESELAAYAAGKNRGITALLASLFVCAIGLAVFLSRRYLAPVLSGLEQVKRRGRPGFEPTNVPEIDDLLDFLSEQNAARETERREMERRLKKLGAEAEAEKIVPPSREAYEAFKKNLATLTKTEREVFDLYSQGHRAKDMPALLYRSANTIKMHNRHIYDKLWVSSREELLGYMKMMKDEGEVTGGEPNGVE